MANATELDARGLKSIILPGQKTFNGKPLPLVVSPSEELGINLEKTGQFKKWTADNKEFLKQLLIEYGTVYFRGFPLNKPVEFDSFVKGFGYTPLPYLAGAAVRNPVVGDVFTANESPPERTIPFHNEMAYLEFFPNVIVFYCNVAPAEGGETCIAPASEIYQRVKEVVPAFIDELEKKGLSYTRIFPDYEDRSSIIGRSWQIAFQSPNKEEAQSKAEQLGLNVEWLPGNCMKTVTNRLDAIKVEPNSGRKVMFNNMTSAFNEWKDTRNVRAVAFGNGESLPAEVMAKIDSVLEEVAVDIKWQEGDVSMIDNYQVLHGRRPFIPPREIFACLCI